MSYTQDNRKFILKTPLGKDVLLFKGLTGKEALSRLFQWEVHAIAEKDKTIAFDALLGKPCTVEMKMGRSKTPCFINGICKAVSQASRDETFIYYKLVLVPKLWLLTRNTQSRIFQQKNVPDILKEVLTGLSVSYELQGRYEHRDYCVQYRETDFNFACRLMEEEGIFYFFKHSDGEHKMVVADSPSSHSNVPGETNLIYEELAGGVRDEERIYSWEKVQEMRSGKTTLWDHCFELPHKNLEAIENTLATIQVGTVTHKLKVGGNDSLELYDWPGEYAQRFDGVDPGGGDRASDVQKIFQDNKRTTRLRMEEETAPAIVIRGASNTRHLRSGHKFNLKRHFSGDGAYVVLENDFEAEQVGDYRSGTDEIRYAAYFTCFPSELPFRPRRLTPRPVVPGAQSAQVVGPPGEELFTDKYGRVKVQFHWDRKGKRDQNSSCWIRVAQQIAGRRWGASFWPRIGQEVIVDFLEGDPDQPVIMGVVYNSDQMPPYLGQGLDAKHKNDNKVSGIKTNTTPGGVGFNEFRFDDTKDKEEIFIHGERDMDVRIKNDLREKIHGNRHLVVGPDGKGQDSKGDYIEEVSRDRHIKVKGNQDEHIGGNKKLLVDGTQHIIVKTGSKEKIQGGKSLTVEGDSKTKVTGGISVEATGAQDLKAGSKYAVDAGQEVHIKGGMTVVVEAGMQLTLKGAGGFISIDPSGVTIQGTMVKINSGGSAGSGAGCSPQAPDAPESAAPKVPDAADDSASGSKSS
jgi:type VI secretion system secreted protein VgrG